MRPALPPPRLVLFCFALCVACLASPLNAQPGTAPDGFVLREHSSFDASAPFALQLGAIEYAPDCSLIVYENAEVRRHPANGSEPIVLARFDPAVFGSFLRMAPDGESVYFGESSSGGIHRIALEGGASSVVDNVAFNFDLAFAPEAAGETVAGRGFVSGLGSQAVNAVWLLDGDDGSANDLVISEIPRFSGPLVFDDEGNLYYVTSGASGVDFGADDEFGQRLVRFTPAQLEAGVGEGVVAFFEGEVLLRDLDGFFGMAWNDGTIYGSNLGFVTGVGTIDAVDTLDEFKYTTFASLGAVNASQLAFCAGDAAFEPGEGTSGGRLAVGFGNFVDTSAIAEIVPELWFVRGRINHDDRIDIGDAIYLLNYLYTGGDEPRALEAGDVNGDGDHDLSDAVFLLSYLFLRGPEPPAPFPEPGPAV